MTKSLEILVTNDDGIAAPGILALAEAALPFGNVTIIAPDRNWSASGHQKALGRPIRVDPRPFALDIPAFSIDGGPSDCVALAGLGFLEKKIDLVLSGINPTANLSRDITYSGTVTSALEATIWNMKGLAFSLDVPSGTITPNFSAAKQVIPHVIRMDLKQELPPFTILNVNIPYHFASKTPEYIITKQGERFYLDEIVKRVDPFGRPYYWFGGLPPTGDNAPDTDCGALKLGKVSITPIHLDLTAHDQIQPIRQWKWNE